MGHCVRLLSQILLYEWHYSTLSFQQKKSTSTKSCSFLLFPCDLDFITWTCFGTVFASTFVWLIGCGEVCSIGWMLYNPIARVDGIISLNCNSDDSKNTNGAGEGPNEGFLIQPSMFSNWAFLSFSVAEFNGWNTKVIYFATYVYTVLEIFMPIQVFRQPWNNDRDSGIPHGSWLPWHVSKVVVQTLCDNMLQQQLNVVYGYKHRESWKQGTVSEIYWI